MHTSATYTVYKVHGKSGYIIGGSPGSGNGLIALGHTDSIPSWEDQGIHSHSQSEEYYLLLNGELHLLIADSLVSLLPNEILMVRHDIPHAVVDGRGVIRHISIRAPDHQDKQRLGQLPLPLPPITYGEEREQYHDWGCRVPLDVDRNQNCWLFGFGSARFKSSHLCFAFLHFHTFDEANSGLGSRHQPHRHERSWEYYAVLRGSKTLIVEDEHVTVRGDEILELPPGICHTLIDRKAPFEGFTFRVPLEPDDKIEC
jgi:mannose-6-phosphate isomerase-like protein (cupin superfamily)